MTGRLPPAAALAAAWTLTLLVEPWSDESVGDLGVRRAFARLFLDGFLPYRDVPFEYPPLAAPLMALPGLAGTGPDAYWAGFAAMAFALALAVLLLTGRLAELTGGSPRVAMLGIAAYPLLVGAVARTHLDLAPVALTLGALLALLTRRPALGFGLLGLGAMTKAFPLVVAPVALAWLAARGERRAGLVGAGALAVTVALVAGVAVALSPAGVLDAASYHLERPPQVESAPAAALLAADAAGAGRAEAAASHRSTGIAHPLAQPVALALAFAGLCVLAWLVAGAARAARAGPRGAAGPDEARALVLASLAAVGAVAAFGKVLSPQFLLWLAPLFALALAWRDWALAAAVALAAALTLVEFPSRYLDLIAKDPVAVGVVAARDVALIAAVLLAARALTPATRRE